MKPRGSRVLRKEQKSTRCANRALLQAWTAKTSWFCWGETSLFRLAHRPLSIRHTQIFVIWCLSPMNTWCLELVFVLVLNEKSEMLSHGMYWKFHNRGKAKAQKNLWIEGDIWSPAVSDPHLYKVGWEDDPHAPCAKTSLRWGRRSFPEEIHILDEERKFQQMAGPTSHMACRVPPKKKKHEKWV